MLFTISKQLNVKVIMQHMVHLVSSKTGANSHHDLTYSHFTCTKT